MQQLVILGSTGSIGLSTLDVVRSNSDRYAVFGLVANTNAQTMAEQCLAFNPRYAVMGFCSRHQGH